MYIMPLTTHEAFVAVVQSVWQLLCALGRDGRHYLAVYSHGYQAKNCQWPSDSDRRPKKHRK